MTKVKDPVPKVPNVPKNRGGRPKGIKRKRANPKHIQQVINPDGKRVWVQKGVDLDKLPHLQYPYNKLQCDQICMLVSEGMTLRQIGQLDTFPPPYIIYKWLRDHEDFFEDLRLAKKVRAELYHDLAVEVAEGTDKKSQVAQNKLKVSTYQWAAEKGNPNEYGRKQVEAVTERPIQIIIDTGVQRGAEVKAVESFVERSDKQLVKSEGTVEDQVRLNAQGFVEEAVSRPEGGKAD